MNKVLTWAGSVLGLISFGIQADAGNWSADELKLNGSSASSLPLWYEYRASIAEAPGAYRATHGSWTVGTVMDGATARAVIWKGTTPYTFSVPTGHHSYVMDTTGWISVGWTSPGNVGLRQAAIWASEGTERMEQHSALGRSGMSDWEISALYAATNHSGSWFAAGYVREALSPTTLSKPALWKVDGAGWSTSRVYKLPLSFLVAGTPTAFDYGIAYGLSEPNTAGTVHACGGVGMANGYLQAQCWNVTNPAAPTAIETPSSLRLGPNAATTVVNRVRTIDLGPGVGKQNVAVGYLMQPNQATMGFIWNLNTGAVSFDTALNSSHDAILSDVTVRSFTATGRANVSGGRIFHGPMVVGTGTNSSAARAASSLDPNQKPTVVRGLARTLIGNSPSSAASAPTCDMEPQIPSTHMTANLALISGVSRAALYMVGADANGKLVRMSNDVNGSTISVNRRRAHVYSTATARSEVTYYWAEVVGARDDAGVKVIWSNQAGCQSLATGAACHGDAAGTVENQRTRRSTTTLPSADFAYIQAAKPDVAPCPMTPVYSLDDLGFTLNPSTDTVGATEDWRECGNVPAGRHTGGANVDVKRDFHHCGACNLTANDGLSCTSDHCIDGRIRNRVNNNQRQRQFDSDRTKWHRGSWEWDAVDDEANSGPSNRNSLSTFIDWVGESGHSQNAINNLNQNGIIYLGVVDNSYAIFSENCGGTWARCASTFNYGTSSSNWRFKLPAKPADFDGTGRYVAHEEWFAFYYNDESPDGNDNLRLSVFYERPGGDVWRNDIDASLFFRCDADGKWNNFRRCPDTTDTSGRIYPWEGNSFGGIDTGHVTRQSVGSYDYCLANVSGGNDGHAEIRLEINSNESSRCGGTDKAKKSGWAIIRIQRWIDGNNSSRVTTLQNNDMCSNDIEVDFYWGHRR